MRCAICSNANAKSANTIYRAPYVQAAPAQFTMLHHKNAFRKSHNSHNDVGDDDNDDGLCIYISLFIARYRVIKTELKYPNDCIRMLSSILNWTISFFFLKKRCKLALAFIWLHRATRTVSRNWGAKISLCHSLWL